MLYDRLRQGDSNIECDMTSTSKSAVDEAPIMNEEQKSIPVKNEPTHQDVKQHEATAPHAHRHHESQEDPAAKPGFDDLVPLGRQPIKSLLRQNSAVSTRCGMRKQMTLSDERHFAHWHEQAGARETAGDSSIDRQSRDAQRRGGHATFEQLRRLHCRAGACKICMM